MKVGAASQYTRSISLATLHGAGNAAWGLADLGFGMQTETLSSCDTKAALSAVVLTGSAIAHAVRAHCASGATSPGSTLRTVGNSVSTIGAMAMVYGPTTGLTLMAAGSLINIGGDVVDGAKGYV